VTAQADLFLEARDLAGRAAGLQAELLQRDAIEQSLQADLAAFPDSGGPSLGNAVEQLAGVLAEISRAAERGVSWSNPRFQGGAQPQAASSQVGAGRNVADLFRPLALSPHLVAAHLSLQGEYRSVATLTGEISRLRALGVVINDVDLEGHHAILGLAILARAP
jgi:hypothetical protein